MQRIYNFDPRNGLFLNEGRADNNPEYERVQAEAAELRALVDTGLIDTERLKALEAEPQFHFPAFCTIVAPPDVPEGSGAYWRGTAWEIALLPAAEGEPPAAEPTAEQKAAMRLKNAEELVDRHMQSVAVGLGYKSLEVAVTYAEEPAFEKYQKEGRLLRSWRSRVWAWFYSEDTQADVAQADFDENSLTEIPKLYPDAEDAPPVAVPAGAKPEGAPPT